MQTDDIIVSVNVITYNQVHYIKRALNSILRQKVNFKYEIRISDDASTDGTQEILRQYKKMYPDIIHLILRKKNVGGTKNAYRVMMQSQGKYIASLEGDDEWCDEEKLQKEVDFLESHKEFIGIMNRCLVVDEKGAVIQDKNKQNGAEFWMYNKSQYTFKDFCDWKMPGHISALLYRNIYKNKKQDYSIFWRAHSMIGDRTTMMLLSANGVIYCDKDIVMKYYLVENKDADNWMAVYKKQNRRFDEFKLMCTLEKYARNNLHIVADMKKAKKNKIAGIAIYWLLNPTLLNFEVLKRSVRYSRKPLYYSVVALNAVLQKKYWILKGKPEHRVSV